MIWNLYGRACAAARRSACQSALLIGALLWTSCSDSEEPKNNAANNSPAPDMTQDMSVNPPPDMAAPVDMAPPVDMTPPGEVVQARAFSVMPPVPVSCDNPSGTYRLPFVILTDKTRPAVLGDLIGGRPLVPNRTVNARSINVRRPRISAMQEGECASNADCSGGFVCAQAGPTTAQRQCTSQTGLELVPNTTRMDYDPGKGSRRQLVTLLLENTGGLTGSLPKDTGELFGEDGQKDLFEVAARATDRDLRHRETVSQLLLQLASVTSSANTRLSAWWFAGDNPIEGVRPLTNPDNPSSQDYFTTDLSELVGKLGKDGLVPSPNNRLGTSNVYQAILRVIEKDLGLAKYKDDEKFLVVVVDGPNEVWDAAATRQTVLAELNKHNVHLFIVHFDPQIDAQTTRDSLTTWAGSRQCRMNMSCAKAPTCLRSQDCDTHETCRPARQYPSMAGEVSDTSESYCMPTYREGRLGPIGAYADLACRTGGNYIYVASVESLRPFLRALPSFFDGQWSVEANLSRLDKAQGIADGFYRLSATFLGIFGNASIGEQFSAPIVDPADPNNVTVDNRPIVRVGRPTGR